MKSKKLALESSQDNGESCASQALSVRLGELV
jgi:hypothetical protein